MTEQKRRRGFNAPVLPGSLRDQLHKAANKEMAVELLKLGMPFMEGMRRVHEKKGKYLIIQYPDLDDRVTVKMCEMWIEDLTFERYSERVNFEWVSSPSEYLFVAYVVGSGKSDYKTVVDAKTKPRLLVEAAKALLTPYVPPPEDETKPVPDPTKPPNAAGWWRLSTT